MHLVTGIAWIGASFYFVWLDNHLQPLQAKADAEKGIGGAMIALTARDLSHLFSGRAMYIEIGAMLSTIMAANVAHIIIPSQRKLVEAKKLGVAPDPLYGLRGRQRSVHNNYCTLPCRVTPTGPRRRDSPSRPRT